MIFDPIRVESESKYIVQAEFEHDNPNPRTRDENGSEFMPNAKNLRGAAQTRYVLH